MMMSNNEKVEIERQRKTEKTEMDPIEAEREFHSELDMDMDIGRKRSRMRFFPPYLPTYCQCLPAIPNYRRLHGTRDVLPGL